MIQILFVIVVCGLLAGLIYSIDKIPPTFKNLAYIVLLIFVVLYIFGAFFGTPNFWPPPRIR